jgi:hypothetical protein
LGQHRKWWLYEDRGSLAMKIGATSPLSKVAMKKTPMVNLLSVTWNQASPAHGEGNDGGTNRRAISFVALPKKAKASLKA